MEGKRFLTANDMVRHVGMSIPMACKTNLKYNDAYVSENCIIASGRTSCGSFEQKCCWRAI